MEGKVIENSGYAGNVSISIFKGSDCVKKITLHNNGKVALFRYIADCLSGYTDSNKNPGLKPGKVCIPMYDSGGSFISNVWASYSDLRQPKSVTSDDNPHAYYSLQFTVASTALNGGSHFNEIQLWPLGTTTSSPSANNMYASVKLENAVYIEDTKTSLVIEWKLDFMNKTVGD